MTLFIELVSVGFLLAACLNWLYLSVHSVFTLED